MSRLSQRCCDNWAGHISRCYCRSRIHLWEGLIALINRKAQTPQSLNYQHRRLHDPPSRNRASVEADFLLWYQQKHRSSTDEPTEVVFGEAKSFGKDASKDEDVERMKLLAEQYPGTAV
jgi:hypothetical protein